METDKQKGINNLQQLVQNKEELRRIIQKLEQKNIKLESQQKLRESEI